VNRWLLNTFTTWELWIIVVGGFVLFAVIGLILFERFLPKLREGEVNDVAGVILGVLAAIYGIVLAFVIVSLYDDFRTTKDDIRTEASAVAMVYRDTRGFSPPVAQAIKANIGDYIVTVRGQEWRDLRHGDESTRAWNDLTKLYVIMQHYTPKTEPQRVFYAEAVGRVNDLMAARRERLNDAEEGIPPTFEVLLIGGALLMLVFTFVFGVKSFRLHAAMVVAVALLIGFNLLVALVLDFPFSGQVSVSSSPFEQGALAVFAPGK
jgi:hypothetical protein